MLPKATTLKAQELLKQGTLSKRAISKELGISRVTLDRIEQRMLFPEGKPQEPQIKIVHFNENDEKLSLENRPTYSRCKTCGGMQQDHVACLVCSTRKKIAEQKKNIKAYDDFMTELLTPPKSPLSGRVLTPTIPFKPKSKASSRSTKKNAISKDAPTT